MAAYDAIACMCARALLSVPGGNACDGRQAVTLRSNKMADSTTC